jgi:hypothetical protein
MKRLKQALFMVIALIVMCGPLAAQRHEKGPKPGPDAVYGRAYNIPAVRAHLTDSETGLPFAEREIGFKYCWGWEVLKRTPETDRISNLMCTERNGKTDKNGIALLPTWLFTPWRPPAPAGAETRNLGSDSPGSQSMTRRITPTSPFSMQTSICSTATVRFAV